MMGRLRTPMMEAVGAWLAWCVGLGSVGVALVLADNESWALWTLLLGGLAFGLVGLILAVRTRHPISWLFLAVQLAMGFALLVGGDAGSALLLVSGAVLIVFPQGRLPSRRWLWAAAGLTLAAVTDMVASAADLDPDGSLGFLLSVVVIYPVVLAGAVRIIRQYIRSRGETREQLKWLAWVLLLGGMLLVLSAIPLDPIRTLQLHQVAGVVLLVGSPIAVGVAVTRYRLYEIDRIISRTVSYFIVLGVLTGAFALLVTAIGSRFTSSFAVAVSTLAVAALFDPLRRRVQSTVDRRFNRSRYDHELIAEKFSSSVRDNVDMDELMSGWIGVVTDTMHPRSVSVWTRAS